MNYDHYTSKCLAAMLLTVSLTLSRADAASLIAPNGLSGREGNTFGYYPFDGALTSMRYQQVFAASQFSLVGPAGGIISDIGFRLDGSCQGDGGQTIPSLQINLSTPSKGPDSLTPVFSKNVGLNDTVVHGASSVTLLGACAGAPARDFSMFIHFSTPFYYNPSAGNLLMDIRNFSGSPSDGSLLLLDAENVAGDSVSHVFAFNVNAPSGSEVDSLGLVAYFAFQP